MNNPNKDSENPNRNLRPVVKQDTLDWIKREAPPEVQKAILSALREHGEMRLSYEAPIPPPASFREYEQVLPGAADRILGFVEQSMTLTKEPYKVARRQIDTSTAISFGMILLTAYSMYLGLSPFVIVPIGFTGVASLLLRRILK